MKIAIIGAGNVGGTLGRRFAETGHEIFFGVPDPTADEEKKSFARVGSVAESAATAEIIVLAIPFEAIADALKECGDVTGKIIVDCTNPLGKTIDGVNLLVGFETSGAERVAELAKAAKVVKCFNQTGAENMSQPGFAGGKSVMFVCGDDPTANETVAKLADEIGFDAIDAGNLKKARLLEPLAMLWIHLSITSDLKRTFAFGLLRR